MTALLGKSVAVCGLATGAWFGLALLGSADTDLLGSDAAHAAGKNGGDKGKGSDTKGKGSDSKGKGNAKGSNKSDKGKTDTKAAAKAGTAKNDTKTGPKSPTEAADMAGPPKGAKAPTGPKSPTEAVDMAKPAGPKSSARALSRTDPRFDTPKQNYVEIDFTRSALLGKGRTPVPGTVGFNLKVGEYETRATMRAGLGAARMAPGMKEAWDALKKGKVDPKALVGKPMSVRVTHGYGDVLDPTVDRIQKKGRGSYLESRTRALGIDRVYRTHNPFEKGVTDRTVINGKEFTTTREYPNGRTEVIGRGKVRADKGVVHSEGVAHTEESRTVPGRAQDLFSRAMDAAAKYGGVDRKDLEED